jgi:hypothetical protein
MQAKRIRSEILRQLDARGTGKSICPSEIARALADDEQEWRAMMPAIREQAAYLSREGAIIVTQKGQMVELQEAKGPIRLALKG